MLIKPLTQCSRGLDFQPRKAWPEVLPALSWRGHLLCGFERAQGEAVELGDVALLAAFTAIYPKLGLGEFARWRKALSAQWPEECREWQDGFARTYGWRWSDRLSQTLDALLQTPLVFQAWVDTKEVAPRDLSPLLALPNIADFDLFLRALADLPVSRSEGTRALELGVELFLLDRPLNDLLPASDAPQEYLRRLERWRRPRTEQADESWRQELSRWPWPSQVQGQWSRVGDQAGLEIKIRTTSPQDLNKKLERLRDIQDTWSCKI